MALLREPGLYLPASSEPLKRQSRRVVVHVKLLKTPFFEQFIFQLHYQHGTKTTLAGNVNVLDNTSLSVEQTTSALVAWANERIDRSHKIGELKLGGSRFVPSVPTSPPPYRGGD